MKTSCRPALLALLLALCAFAAQAQTWNARRIVAEVQAPTVVLKDKNGNTIERLERSQVEQVLQVVDRLATRMALASPAVAIEKGDSPNAYATYVKPQQSLVGINTAMLRLVGHDEDMMAAVIGHELGHLQARHQDSRQNTALALGLFGALVGGAIDGRHGPGMGSVLGSVGANLGVAKFTRDQEREADRIGVEAMARAGYDPDAAPRMWRQMAAAGGGGSGLWLSSHPSHAEREQALSAAATTLKPTYLAARTERLPQVAATEALPRSAHAGFEPTPEEVAAATAYARGRPLYVQRQFGAAQPLLEEAAAAGDDRAMALLGQMAQRGDTGAPDAAKAREWFEAAARAGFGPGMTALGVMALNGQGGPVDRARGSALLRGAADRGEPRGMAMLGLLHLDGTLPRDPQQSRELAQRSAEAGDTLGKALLGMLLRDGLGGPADPARGFELLADASKANAWASYQLGLAYERGLGTPVDREKAIAAHQSAAERGVGAAQARLRALGQ